MVMFGADKDPVMRSLVNRSLDLYEDRRYQVQAVLRIALANANPELHAKKDALGIVHNLEEACAGRRKDFRAYFVIGDPSLNSSLQHRYFLDELNLPHQFTPDSHPEGPGELVAKFDDKALYRRVQILDKQTGAPFDVCYELTSLSNV